MRKRGTKREGERERKRREKEMMEERGKARLWSPEKFLGEGEEGAGR